MAPIDWNWSERYESPTLTAQLFHVHNQQDVSDYFGADSFQKSPNKFNPQLSQPPPNSRKRSRDQLSDIDTEFDHSSRSSPMRRTRTPSPLKPKGEPLYGPGMTLIYLGDPSYNAIMGDASSQTGTWAEELSERLRSSTFTENRPPLESRKSMRMDSSAPGLDDIALATLSEDSIVRLTNKTAGSKNSIPTIDVATHTLGIAWTTIPKTDTMDAASRGWARYIEAHFPLKDVRIVWQNKTIPAYLVSAVTTSQRSPGYWLFDEALSEGRLVARTWEKSLENLNGGGMVFEGNVPLLRDELMNVEGYMQEVCAEAEVEAKGVLVIEFDRGKQSKNANATGIGNGMDVEMSM